MFPFSAKALLEGVPSYSLVYVFLTRDCSKNNSSFIRDVPLTPYFHLTDGNLTKDTYNVLRRL